MDRKIMGIDPGQKGALVIFDGEDFAHWRMPVAADGRVDFEALLDLIVLHGEKSKIYLERAMPLAMGSKHAFNYGRDFAAIEIAVSIAMVKCVQVEPAKWAKVIHQGVSNDLRPKAKSLIALKRLAPSLFDKVPKGPKSGKPDEGVVDALLIAIYGFRETYGG